MAALPGVAYPVHRIDGNYMKCPLRWDLRVQGYYSGGLPTDQMAFLATVRVMYV